MVGKTLGHYEFVEPLGSGGMGEVYRAHDTRLRRDVAVKVLPDVVADDAEHLARLQREAHLLASLNHPNIATIHSLEEADGTRLLVMELVEGETLHERLQAGLVPVREALAIFRQVAAALEAAHERGIVHRDLKPANVMVDAKGNVKVLDFGIAKPLGGEGEGGSGQVSGSGPSAVNATRVATDMAARLTATGMMVGTVPYMSPEQVRGQPVDERSDVWAFGCLIFELLTGRRPFGGETPADALSAILEREPSWDLLPSDTPSSIRTLARRCLEKDPDARLHHIADARIEIDDTLQSERTASLPVASARKRLTATVGAVAAFGALIVVLVAMNVGGLRDALVGGGSAAGPTTRSLAVLPLDNLSGDTEQEYFADGMTEALITDLSKIGALRVISRTSAMRYKGTDKPLPEIARELGVDAVVEGSVLREGDRVRVTAQLIDAASDEHLWAESYERDLTSVLALQGDVARAIAREIEIALSPREAELLAARREVDPETYEAYLRGMFHLNQLTPAGIDRGLGYLHRAVEKDAADPLAHAGLALGYSLVASHSPDPPPDAIDRARASALRALKLDDTLAEAHGALAEIRLYTDWDWRGAERSFRRALQLNPSLAPAHAHYAMYLNLFGRQDEALEQMRRAQQVDPLNPLWTCWIGDLHWTVGRYDEAIEQFHEALELDPDFPWAYHMLGAAYTGKGMYEEAIEAHRKSVEANPAWRWALAPVLAAAGRRDEARQIAAELERQGGDPFGMVAVYTGLGEIDEALRWAERAYEARHPFTPWITRAVVFEPLQDDPRLEDLRRRLNLPR